MKHANTTEQSSTRNGEIMIVPGRNDNYYREIWYNIIIERAMITRLPVFTTNRSTHQLTLQKRPNKQSRNKKGGYTEPEQDKIQDPGSLQPRTKVMY